MTRVLVCLDPAQLTPEDIYNYLSSTTSLASNTTYDAYAEVFLFEDGDITVTYNFTDPLVYQAIEASGGGPTWTFWTDSTSGTGSEGNSGRNSGSNSGSSSDSGVTTYTSSNIEWGDGLEVTYLAGGTSAFFSVIRAGVDISVSQATKTFGVDITTGQDFVASVDRWVGNVSFVENGTVSCQTIEFEWPSGSTEWQFYASTYSEMVVCPSGLVSFDTDILLNMPTDEGQEMGNNTQLTGAAIAPLWAALAPYTACSSVRYGFVDDDQMILQFDTVGPMDFGRGSTAVVELQLYECR